MVGHGDAAGDRVMIVRLCLDRCELEPGSKGRNMKHLLIILTCLVLAGPGVARAQEGGSDSTGAYALGPDDAVQIQVWQRADLSGTYVVDGQGNIMIPLLGAVPAAGQTAAELGKELERRYAILDPGISEVLVTVVRYASHYLTVVGEVKNPGRYTFRDMPSLWDALLAAGGTTADADMAAVQVVRKSRSESQPKTLTVDLSKGLEDTPTAGLPELKPGDSVVVPSTKAKGGISGDQVQVLGAVQKPGIYALRSAGTVVEALSASGGASGGADLSAVRLARRTGDGVVVYELDVQGYLYQGYPAADLGLKPGDTVTVPARSGGAWGVLRAALSLAPVVSAVASVIILARN